jgi:hypothetical protein
MSVIAGIFIGWFNDDWLVRFLAPVAWGIAWGLRLAILRAPPAATPRFGLQGEHAHRLVEIGSAATTALAFSLLAGGARLILHR